MLKKISYYSFFFITTFVISQNNNQFCKKVSALDSLINTNHYNPKEVNDTLSKNVFNLFINSLDTKKQFFTNNDINEFKTDEYKIDDYIRTKECSFLNKYINILKKRIEQSIHILESLSEVEFNYLGKDTLKFSPEKEYTFFKNKEKIEPYWNRRIRFLTLAKLIEEDSILANIKLNFKNSEPQARLQTIKSEVCKLNEILNQEGGLTEFVEELFLNAVTNYQDPHSYYFNNVDKTIFENELSSNQLSFGITTRKTRNGNIIVAQILPGSSAFKNGNIEINDIIKSLKSSNSFLETTCVSNSEVKAFTSNNAHKTILFKLKKKDGTIKKVQLTKSLNKVEENTLRAYVLNDSLNFGYIKIPSFYTNEESFNGLGLSNDVAKELHKLQKENISGLILDLRNNGGGSMQEAANLSGMFIHRGPLSIIKYKNKSTFTIKDRKRGTSFSRPIIVLVNSYSASASEFFAATMQDYNRAIIIGAKTHGKSTAQVISSLSETENLGYVKLTIEKFYRINGNSIQAKGVSPDIILPFLEGKLKTGEEYSKYALSNDTVKIALKAVKYPPFKLTDIKENSKLRIKNSPVFKNVNILANRILTEYINRKKSYTLNIENVFNDINSYKDLWKNVSNGFQCGSSNLIIKNTKSTQEILSYNQNEKEINSKFLNNIVKDIYIIESSSILKNYILTSK